MEDNKTLPAEELERFKEIIRSNAHLIMEFSQKGGVLNAANF